ncbi:outer membrane beta-barrel protein [Candidatus Proelusimicrobium volucris]|uniref:outer membrane beta-barrel protein n=1 Tax=Candidatus Proelusimicrobium volucris TaxID=3416225 RepID=UPI003D09BAE8
MKKLLLLAVSLLVVNSAFAGDVKFLVSEDLSYDDNIYLTDGNEKDSFISKTQAGVTYANPIAGSGLELNATALGGYNAYTEDNGKNGFWNAYANVDVKNDLLKIGDSFLYTSDQANSELTERAKRLNNNFYLSAKTSTDKKFGFGVVANDSYDYYIDNPWKYDLTRNRLNAGVQAFYNISSKTSAFVEYVYTNIAYKDNTNNDSDGSAVALGVEGKIAQKVSGVAKVNYVMRDYSHDMEGYSSYEDLVGYYVALSWNPTERNTVRLSGERRFEESVYENNRYFTDTLVSLYGSHKLSDKLTAGLTLAYENMAYDRANNNGVKRSDDLFTVRPELDYQFQEWLSAGVWYQFRNRDSNTNGNDYASNKGGVFVKALF